MGRKGDGEILIKNSPSGRSEGWVKNIYLRPQVIVNTLKLWILQNSLK
jgi:hypothetical protein